MTQTEPALNYSSPPAGGITPAGTIRWVMCGLLFFATTINYMDRQILAIFKSSLSKHFQWNEDDYGNIVAAFQFAYALGYLFAGRMMDWMGVKRGFPLAVGLWSVAAGAHGLLWFVPADPGYQWTIHLFQWTFSGAASVISFALLRVSLGVFEGGNFPASVKVVAEWFPTRERALATGIFNSGTNIGAMICPALVPWIASYWGWAGAFYTVGGLGVLWIVMWMLFYDPPERHRWLGVAERAYIQGGRAPAAVEPAKVSWIGLLRFRATWAFVVGMLMTSPVWWFYLFWIPGFLQKRFGLADNEIGLPVGIIYFIAIFGSVGGGWLASFFMGRGMRLNAARKISMLICALFVLPVFLAPVVPNLWVSVVIVGIAASAHQGWAANLYTLVSDTMPKKSVSSVVGMGGLAGGLAGAVTAKLAGMVLQASGGNYFALFAVASGMYLVALLIIQLLVPRIMQVAQE